MSIHFRASGPLSKVVSNLGLLGELPGKWVGNGFNLIGRPFFQNNPPFFLELNSTDETLEFTAVGGNIPNRGSKEPDISLFGVRYLQQVTDCANNTGIHIEPGLWIHVPPTTAPQAGESYVRQATIPHGDALLAQSTFFATASGGPTIKPVNSFPFTDPTIPGLNANPVKPVTDPAYLKQYLIDVLPMKCLPEGLDAATTIKDPTEVLRAQIKGQNIVSTVVIGISTAAPGNIVNIPFIQQNANAAQVDAIFWIETVKNPDGETFMQLQYVQRVILNFIGINWPHISVATLVKQ
jgi:hypothetical protein